MEPERTPRGHRASNVVVLVGMALFVASCFIPYYAVGLGGRNEAVTLFEQLQFGSDDWTLDLGTILFLFGAAAVVAALAITGLLAHGYRMWRPAMLAVVVLAWSLTWFGVLLRQLALLESTLPSDLSLEVGFWMQAASILVAIIGTMAVLVTARRGAHEQQPSSGP